MLKNQKFVFICVLIAVSVFFGSATVLMAANEATKTIRFTSHIAPSWYGIKHAFEPYAKMIEQDSGGRLKVKFFLGGVLHGPKDGFKAASTDITDLTNAYPSYVPGVFHLTDVDGIPFLFPNAYVASLVMEELYPKYFKKEYEAMGVYLMAYPMTSNYQLMTRNKPVRSLEDLKGMKIRSAGDTTNAILKALGAVPVVLPYAQIYSALDKGLVDGALTSIGDIGTHRHYEVAKYITIIDITAVGVAYCMNKKTYNGLPKDLQKVVYNNNRKFAQLLSGQYETAAKSSLKLMEANKMEVITLTPKEYNRWKEAVAFIENDFVEKNEAAGRPARQMMKDLKLLVKKYEKLSPQQIWKLVSEKPIQGIND